ncbi:MAG: hypothetical protein NZ866_02985 [Patescibacteria group bacterium]|nr:hypothetical protein [Patescibacteria group bacterium]
MNTKNPESFKKENKEKKSKEEKKEELKKLGFEDKEAIEYLAQHLTIEKLK